MESYHIKTRHWKGLGSLKKLYCCIYLSLYPLTHKYKNITLFELISMLKHIDTAYIYYNKKGKVGGISILFYQQSLDIYNLWGYYKRDCSFFKRYKSLKSDYKHFKVFFEHVLEEHAEKDLWVFVHPEDDLCLYECLKQGFKYKGQHHDKTKVLLKEKEI